MRKRRLLLSLCALCAGASAAGRTPERQEPTSPSLMQFQNEAEFREYLHDAQANRRARLAAANSIDPALGDSLEDGVSDPPGPDPAIQDSGEAGVDEGDVVRRLGRFLLVLKDDWLFSVDTAPDGRPGVALADRFDLSRGGRRYLWRKEMFLLGDHVLVSGAPDDGSTNEFDVLRIGPDGRLESGETIRLDAGRADHGTDYATRLAGNRLVVYSRYPYDHLQAFTPPGVRIGEGEATQPLFAARDIYRPLVTGDSASLHVVSICRLGPDARILDCRATGILAPADAEFHVTGSHVYLWVTDWPEWNARRPVCTTRARPDEVARAIVYRIPLAGGPPTVAGARGSPTGPLALMLTGDELHALVGWQSTRCRDGEHPRTDLAFATIPDSAFGPRFNDAPARAFTAVPGAGTDWPLTRFSGDFLVYGEQREYLWLNEEMRETATQTLVLVPLARPAAAHRFSLPFGLLGIEPAGSELILTGYRDRTGLVVMPLLPGSNARLGPTLTLGGRFDGLGSGYARDGRREANGGALLGIPTVPPGVNRFGGDPWSYSYVPADISFLTRTEGGRLEMAGELVSTRRGGPAPGCAVACEDWYWTARPILMDGRTFALVGSELIEGVLDHGRMRELRRLDLATANPRIRPDPPPRQPSR